MQTRAILIILFGLLLAGCSTTTEESRARDRTAAKIVADYRQRQEDRINRFDSDYQRYFEEQMKRLDALGQDDLTQRMELQAMEISDKLLLNWEEKTLPGQFRDAIFSEMQKDFSLIEDIESNLASARQKYASGYSEISMETKKLIAAQNGLEDLAIKSETQRDLAVFLKAVYAAYRDAQKERERQASEDTSQKTQ